MSEYIAPWYPMERVQKTMPCEIWEMLTPYAQHLCRFCRADEGVWPVGAGMAHPLPSGREALVRGRGG